MHSKEGGRKRSSNQRSRERGIPISYAVRHKGRHSFLFLFLPSPPIGLANSSCFLHAAAARASRPPNSLALWPLSPLCLPELCNFRDHTEDALHGGDDVARGLYSRRRWREHRRRTRLEPHFAPKSRVDDDEHNDDDMYADGGLWRSVDGQCMKGLANTEWALETEEGAMMPFRGGTYGQVQELACKVGRVSPSNSRNSSSD